MRRSNLTDSGSTVDQSLDIGAISKSLSPVSAPPPEQPKSPEVKQLRDAQHGEIVRTEDGGYGLVIDTQEEFKKKYHDEGMDRLFSLGLENDPLFDSIAIKTQPTENVYELICAKFGPESENARKFKETQEEFAQYTYGPEGLVRVDDPRAEEYKRKIDLIRTGKVRLPTVSEYEKALKEAKESRRNQSMENEKNLTTPETPATPTPPEEVVPAQQMMVVDPNANISGVQPIRRNEQPKPQQQPQNQRVIGAAPIQRQTLADVLSDQEQQNQPPTVPPMPQIQPMQLRNNQPAQPAPEPVVQQPVRQQTPVAPQPMPQPVVQQPVQQTVQPIPQPQVAQNPTPAPAPVNTPPVHQPQPQTPQPINLAQAMAEQQLNKTPQAPPPSNQNQQQQQPAQVQSVTFEVPEEAVPVFYDTLPDDTKQKVETSKVVKINAISLADVPTATRRITSIDQYRSAIPRSVTGDLVQKVLINSGYIATMKGATSLEMVTIAHSQDDRPDYPKEIQFCYDHLVDTSIGKMSYARFVQETSSLDIPTLLAAIYQASEPDTKALTVKCSNCAQDQDIEFAVPNIWDDSDFDDETIKYFNEIVEAQTDVDKAIAVHQRAPVMQINYLQFNDTYFGVKQTDCQMSINYFPEAPTLSEKYNELVTVLSAFIKEVRIVDTTSVRAKNSPDGQIVYVSDQLDVICRAVIERLDNDEAQGAFSDFILRKLPELKQYKFLMKPAHGDAFVCPRCGERKESMPINIDQLIFFKAQSAVMPQ